MELHPGCILCKKRNTAKHDVIDDYTGKVIIKKGEFVIRCDGVPADPEQYLIDITDPAIVDYVGEDALRQMARVTDPVLWAQDNIVVPDMETKARKPWQPQGASQENIERYDLPPDAAYYQEIMAKCTARRQLYRIGRRCLPAGQLVAMSDGTFKPIEEIEVGDYVQSKNMSRGTLVSKKVTHTYGNGVRKIYRVALNDGSSIRCTDNHPLLKSVAAPRGYGCSMEWTSIEGGLTVGDRVQVARSISAFGKPQEASTAWGSEDVAKAALLGYLLTDGYLPASKQTPKFTSTNKLYIDEVDDLSFELFSERGHARDKESETLQAWDYCFTDGNRGTPSFIKDWLLDLGVLGQKTSNKRVPKFIFKGHKYVVTAFLNRAWAGDGCVYLGPPREGRARQIELNLTSASLGLLEDCRLLLRKLGVNSRIKEGSNQDNWKLCVMGAEDIEQFFLQVGPIYGKEHKSEEVLTVAKGISRRARAKGYTETRLAKIVSIEEDGEEETFDITVDKWHNFLVDGIVTHNSGKTWTLIAKVLHKMFTAPGGKYRILVITPNIAQLDIIFGTARDFISMSPTLSNTVARYVKSPQRYLELHNGSFMRGFVSGNESIRGQAADMIVIDEGDYLTTDDLSAIIAILSEHKDTILTVSSTPSGARETFWKWDQDPKFRSFHFPSMCRPLWDEDMEIEQRIENPGVRFVHEILAEYGEIAEGVFQHDDIDLAVNGGDYKYQDEIPQQGWIYTMGVDWNPIHGTEIYVVGTDTALSSPVYKVVDHGQVFREGNTQIQAVNEIIRLNRKWTPSAIFVDRGAGSVQIELLNEAGRTAPPNTPDKKLETIVEAIDFGSKIEMRHPSNGRIQKVYAKPAVVENAIRMFEAKQTRLSKFDTDLTRQLRGYIVDKIAANGRPSYAMISDNIEDHKLDAYLLALFAFTLKFSKFGQPDIIPIVRFAGQPGASTVGIPQSIKPKSRSIHDPVQLEKKTVNKEEERLENRNGFIDPKKLRTIIGAGASPEAQRFVQGQLAQRNRATRRSRGRAPVRRSNISRSNGRSR